MSQRDVPPIGIAHFAEEARRRADDRIARNAARGQQRIELLGNLFGLQLRPIGILVPHEQTRKAEVGRVRGRLSKLQFAFGE